MSPQHPLPSGFGAKTTTRELIGERRLDGTTAIVTGGYAGIGLETTRVLAAAGAHVIVPARDLAKATAALSGLANVTIDELDLAALSEIDKLSHTGGLVTRDGPPAPLDPRTALRPATCPTLGYRRSLPRILRRAGRSDAPPSPFPTKTRLAGGARPPR
jgi:hypothetical protein